MKEFFFVILIIFCLSIFTRAQTYETGDNDKLYGCSTKCTLEDSSLTCWNQTLTAFEHFLMDHMNFYVAVQTNIDQWHRRHDSNYSSNFKQMLSQSNKSMQSYIHKDDIIDSEMVSNVVTSLMNAVENKSTKSIDWVWHYSCPIPCSYFYDTYFMMFLASMFLNIAFLCAMAFEWFFNDDDD
uniref:Uncharacterized protein n=1 Tax=Panagrolaimus sp. PS1159 TaxID=55785 RepID=A0AC35FMJ0_9BILA